MRFFVYLRSAPGMWERYEGRVQVVLPLATGATPGTEGELYECNACRCSWSGYTDDGCCPYCHSGETSELDGGDLEHHLKRLAVRELARTSFPDRPSLESWRVIATEALAN